MKLLLLLSIYIPACFANSLDVDIEPQDIGERLWTTTVYARESSSSEYSARYQTESSLRYKVDQQKYLCDRERGSFSQFSASLSCNKSGPYSWSCSTYATCSCRK